MDRKKIGMYFLFGAVFLLIVLLVIVLVSLLKKPADPEVPKVNVGADVPQAMVEEVPDSKLAAYEKEQKKRSTIEDYWDDIEGEEESVDGAVPVSDTGSCRVASYEPPVRNGSGSVGRTATYEELFGSAGARGSSEGDVEARRLEREKRMTEAMERMNRQRTQAAAEIVAAGAAAAASAAAAAKPEQPEDTVAVEAAGKEVRETIDLKATRVVRSGGVSSLHDSERFGETGISSLSEHQRETTVEETYPFRCMFVRQEKLKSSQRVSIRILEDIVVEGHLIKKNTHLTATCSIGDRVDLKVTSINVGGRFLNLDFDAYDNDGTRGIYAPRLNDDTRVEESFKRAGISTVRRRMSTMVGQTAQDFLNAGTAVITGSGKDPSVIIPAGYEFYLVKKVKKQ